MTVLLQRVGLPVSPNVGGTPPAIAYSHSACTTPPQSRCARRQLKRHRAKFRPMNGYCWLKESWQHWALL